MVNTWKDLPGVGQGEIGWKRPKGEDGLAR